MKYNQGDQSLVKAEPKPIWMSDAESAQHASQQMLATPAALARVVWRRKWVVAGCLALAMAGGTLYIRKATPMYTAIASVLVEKTSPKLIGTPLDANSTAAGNGYLYTHCSIIASTTVLTNAVNGLDTSKMVTFAPPVGTPAGQTVKPIDPVQYLQNNLLADVGKKDSLIYLTLAGPNPNEAALLVNRVTAAYSDFVGQQTRSTASDALKILNREREKAEKDFDGIATKMIEFRRSHGSLAMASGGGSIVMNRLGRLSDELTNAQIELTEANGSETASNSMMSARKRVEAATTRVATLQKAYEEQEKLAIALNSDEAEYLKMQAEQATADRRLKQVVTRINEVDLAQDAGMATVKVIEAAVPPFGQSSPQKMRVLLASLFLGLVSGIGLAWLRDWTDPRLRGTDEMVSTLGMPVLGMIPHMTGRQSPALRGRKVQLEFMSDIAEAYRTLRTSIYFGTRNEPAKTLLITSPTQGDGKSTTASNLAIAMAQAGRRTLIVDTDFRRPQLHKIFEVKDDIGLSSVLAGRETLDTAIHATGVKGLEILPCGPIPSNPSEILNSDAFGKLLMSLATRYDMILLDSPPVSPVTDARILGAICDATLLVLKSDRSTRKNATMAADALHAVGARVLGIVCNGMSRNAAADRYYSGYGYGFPQGGRAQRNGSGAARRLPAAQMAE